MGKIFLSKDKCLKMTNEEMELLKPIITEGYKDVVSPIAKQIGSTVEQVAKLVLSPIYYPTKYLNTRIENWFTRINKEISKENYIGFWGTKFLTKNKTKQIWFCLYYTTGDNENKISLWCAVYDFKPEKNSANCLTYSDYYNNINAVNCSWFSLKNDYFNKLCSENSYQEKYDILNGFFSEIDKLK